MYPAYAKWVQSHRDLPIKLNQWCNVVVGILLQWHLLLSFINPVFHVVTGTKQQPKHVDGLFRVYSCFHLPEMGVQASSALPEDQRVPVAGGTYGFCHQRGSRWRGNTWTVLHNYMAHSKVSMCVCVYWLLYKEIIVGVLDICAGAADPGSVCQSVRGADGNPSGEGEEDGEGEICRRRLHHDCGGFHLCQWSSHSGAESSTGCQAVATVECESLKTNPWIWMYNGVRWCSSGCHIPPSWSELLQDVWDHVWRSKKARREAAGLPEFLGTHNQNHRCPHYGPWR